MNMRKIFYAIYLGIALQAIQVQACCLNKETTPVNKAITILQSPKADNAKVTTNMMAKGMRYGTSGQARKMDQAMYVK